ncbi:MAG TPA: metal-dependent transcriptional regulator [Bacteroidota bacterium]|nr:metal-dependent transcriptional regulator [Bacteroidota bacterium]
MVSLTNTEENYLKAIYVLSAEIRGRIANSAIAERLSINPATVTEMLRRLHKKRLIDYNRRQGASLSEMGRDLALKVVRKHRLWETFLVQKMAFTWAEVHEVAEQLEHLRSEKLTERLDKLLGYPQFDPHGDPIPDEKGRLPESRAIPLSEKAPGRRYRLVGVADDSPVFLTLLDDLKLALNDTIEIKQIQKFDKSVNVLLNGKARATLSWEISHNLLVV